MVGLGHVATSVRITRSVEMMRVIGNFERSNAKKIRTILDVCYQGFS
jgi:hypothetical protein